MPKTINEKCDPSFQRPLNCNLVHSKQVYCIHPKLFPCLLENFIPIEKKFIIKQAMS